MVGLYANFCEHPIYIFQALYILPKFTNTTGKTVINSI